MHPVHSYGDKRSDYEYGYENNPCSDTESVVAYVIIIFYRRICGMCNGTVRCGEMRDLMVEGYRDSAAPIII